MHFSLEEGSLGGFLVPSVWKQAYLNIHKTIRKHIQRSENIFFFQPIKLLRSTTSHLFSHRPRYILKQCSLRLLLSFLADLNSRQFGRKESVHFYECLLQLPKQLILLCSSNLILKDISQENVSVIPLYLSNSVLLQDT